MTTWIAMVGVGLGSYLLRFTPLAQPRREPWPPPLDRAIRRAALAVLTALVVSGLQHHGTDGGSVGTLLAAAAAVASLVVARRRGSMVAAVSAGLVTYWSLTALADVLR
jgi:branched-subunit amino acid transport protein